METTIIFEGAKSEIKCGDSNVMHNEEAVYVTAKSITINENE